MCAKLKAENYVLMIDAKNLECMTNLFKYLPTFSDIYTYCENAWFIKLSLTFVASLSMVVYYL